MAGWTGKRVNVAFSKPEEPSFLKKFKERVGYKEDHGLSEKFAVMPSATEEDEADKDDEMPQVVALRSGDLTQEEVDHLRSEGTLDNLLNDEDEEVVQGPKERDGGEVRRPKEKDEEPLQDGKIMFRKPDKRSKESHQKTNVKKLKGNRNEENLENISKVKKKGVQDKKLLSFDEDEEDEEC